MLVPARRGAARSWFLFAHCRRHTCPPAIGTCAARRTTRPRSDAARCPAPRWSSTTAAASSASTSPVDALDDSSRSMTSTAPRTTRGTSRARLAAARAARPRPSPRGCPRWNWAPISAAPSATPRTSVGSPATSPARASSRCTGTRPVATTRLLSATRSRTVGGWIHRSAISSQSRGRSRERAPIWNSQCVSSPSRSRRWQRTAGASRCRRQR